MPVWSENQRLALLGKVKAHIFWGFRSFLDFQAACTKHGAEATLPIVIADKGFTDRRKTVFSVNQEWGRLGSFVVNPRPKTLDIEPCHLCPGGYVLELGQDPNDFSTKADHRADGIEGYREWLEQWPERRFRPHPSVQKPSRSLAEDVAGATLVVGLNTSALVEASIAGRRVEAYGAHSVARGIDIDRAQVLDRLRSFEWDRADTACAEAIGAAIMQSEVRTFADFLDELGPSREEPEATPRPRTARTAAQKSRPTTRQAGRAQRSRA